MFLYNKPNNRHFLSFHICSAHCERTTTTDDKMKTTAPNEKGVVFPVSASPSPPSSPGGDGPAQRKRGLRFRLIILSLCLTLSLSALELTAVSTALPTIVSSLHGTDFIWVGIAYALASTAILPMTSGIAQMFGRKPAVLGAMAIFTVGSAVCGSAKNMATLIAGRTVQGLGGGGILSFNSIILGDLVPLKDRGLYAGLFGL